MDNLRRALPPLTSLVPFEAAARLESFSKAAEELCLTQAAISRQIRALEEHLSLKLFERRNRAVYLTEAGLELSDTIRRSLQGIASEAERLRNGHRDDEVIVFSQLCEALYWITPNLPEFYRYHPRARIRLISSIKPLVEAAERFDVAVQTTGRLSGDHTCLLTLEDEVFPVCSPGYLTGVGGFINLERIAEYDLLHHRVAPQDWMTWDDWLRQVGSEEHIGYRGQTFDSYPVMMQSCITGMGLALGWRKSTGNLIDRGELVRPFKQSVALPNALSVFKWRNSRLSSSADSVVAWLKDTQVIGAS